jgi:hypothetical protein
MIMQCSATTTKGLDCPIHADRVRNGKWFCHVHDPEGLYQQQCRDKREFRAARKSLMLATKKNKSKKPR